MENSENENFSQDSQLQGSQRHENIFIVLNENNSTREEPTLIKKKKKSSIKKRNIKKCFSNLINRDKKIHIFSEKQFVDLSKGLEKVKILFPVKYRTKLLRTNFDYKLSYITKSYILNGNIDDYLLPKDYSCSCNYDCKKESCDCTLKHVQKYECNENCDCNLAICTNRKVQHGLMKHLKIDYISKEKGFGVFTQEKIFKEEFICEYVGKIINKTSANEKIKVNLMRKKANYVLQIRENYEKLIVNTFIDAEEKGNASRFLNHSCEPNLYFDIVRIRHFIPQVAFFANRDIEPGEELTFSYYDSVILNESIQFEDYENKLFIQDEFTKSYKPCLCGSKNCQNFLPS
jgi:hypothetical protein